MVIEQAHLRNCFIVPRSRIAAVRDWMIEQDYSFSIYISCGTHIGYGDPSHAEHGEHIRHMFDRLGSFEMVFGVTDFIIRIAHDEAAVHFKLRFVEGS